MPELQEQDFMARLEGIENVLNEYFTIVRETENTLSIVSGSGVCECGNVMTNEACFVCGAFSNTLLIDYSLYSETAKKKYKSIHNVAKYMQRLLMNLKNVSKESNIDPNLDIDLLKEKVKTKNINNIHNFKRFIYKNYPKYKDNYRSLYCKINNLSYDQEFLPFLTLNKICLYFKQFKLQNYFPSRIMFLKIFYPDIYQHYSNILESVICDKKYLPYYNNSNE